MTLTSWATRRGSYLTVLSYGLLQSLVMTHYSLARVVYGYLYKFLKLGSLTGLILNDQLQRSLHVSILLD